VLRASQMPDSEKLRHIIHERLDSIKKMHVTAWRHKKNKDIAAMSNVHKRIKMAKRHILECQSAIRGQMHLQMGACMHIAILIVACVFVVMMIVDMVDFILAQM
jgi:hypothetical protein